MTEELTCHNSLGLWQSRQHMFNEAHICTGLQIAYALPQDCDEDAPDLSLQKKKQH